MAIPPLGDHGPGDRSTVFKCIENGREARWTMQPCGSKQNQQDIYWSCTTVNRVRWSLFLWFIRFIIPVGLSSSNAHRSHTSRKYNTRNERHRLASLYTRGVQ